jgi:sulfotransferase
MSKTVHFISGPPRSCSTLLCNLLAQNPKFHSTASSGLVDLMYPARKNLSDSSEFHAMRPQDAENMFLDWARGGIVNAFNSQTDRPVVFDKGRSWIGYLDLLFQLFPDAKVLVPVRDIRGVITSMEKIRRKHPAYFNAEEHPATKFTTVERRAQEWLSSPKVGIALERLSEAVKRFKDRLHFVHAEDLTENPQREMDKIHKYLNEEFFLYNPDNVEQYTNEWDGVWWPYGDHTIRGKITKLKPEWNEILGKPLANAINEKFNWINEL